MRSAFAFLACAAAALQRTGPAAAPPSTRFEDVAARAGLAIFRHVGGSTPDKKYIPEVMSGGVCAFDFDGDGWTDVFGGQRQSFPATPTNRLYRLREGGALEALARPPAPIVRMVGSSAKEARAALHVATAGADP